MFAGQQEGWEARVPGGRQAGVARPRPQGAEASRARSTPLAGKAGARPPRCDWGAQAGRRGGCGGQGAGRRESGRGRTCKQGCESELAVPRQKSERRRREEGLPAAAGLRASVRPGAGRGRGSGRVGEGGRGWARGRRGGRKTSSCSCSQLGRKDALRRTEGSWGGGAGGGRRGVCGARQWRGEDGRVCPAGQKAGLSGVGFEPTPPGETAT